MSAGEDSRVSGRARLSFASVAEIDEFVATLGRFERGEITPDQWRTFRLVHGTYGQRQEDVQMVRVKVPQGILDAAQLRALAAVARNHSRGFGHVTTRQNLQFHFVGLANVEQVMRDIELVGLTTREACGSTVRNITACPYSGVAADELFDVVPYAESLTRYLLRHPLSSSLPRKFKIAFEGCPTDHALVSINDLGFKARFRTGSDGRQERGFRVTVGGGTAIMPRTGNELEDFVPAAAILDVAEAVIRVFHKFGDREHRHRNRLKYLIKTMGWEAWRQEVRVRYAEIQTAGGTQLPFDAENPPVEGAPIHSVRPVGLDPVRIGRSNGPGPVYLEWKRTNVRHQKQPGYSTVTAVLVLGDVTARQLDLLADLATEYGDGTLRFTPAQDLMLRWIRTEDVPAVFDRLVSAGLSLDGANTIADVTSCPGADTCRLAVTHSRGLGKILGEFLRSRPDLVAQAPDLQLKISGCPNGCGQHHIAGIGFQGSVRSQGGKTIPHYLVTIGGSVEDQQVQFGKPVGRIPARRIPQALERLLDLYRAESAEGETAVAFFRRVESERARHYLANLEMVSLDEATEADTVDLGETRSFVLETAAGECAGASPGLPTLAVP